ncbi:MAG TPA: hemolysin III family protein [Acidimicrobiales bacterium]|nr:hemolysin III family protein [Acidimicrobiales bacterium]
MTPPTTLEPADVAPDGAPAATARPKPRLRGWLHALAFVAICVAGPILVAQAPTAGARAALVVYVLSIAALFGVSAAFHLVHWSPPARRRMRRADHSTIFVAIAGTYTAVAGLALSGWAQTTILLVVWIGAAAGITLRQVWLDAPKWAVALPYVVVGWCALLVVPQLVHSLGGVGFGLLLAGGAAYTVGAVAYARRRPDPWPAVFGYHEVFHLCTVIGATLHFAVIARFALPLA